MSIRVEFKGWEEDASSEYKVFYLGKDKSVISLLQKGPIPKGFILTLNEPAYYRVAGIGLHELGYTGLDITPEMFESNLTLEMVAKPELFDMVPQNYSQEGSGIE